MAEGGIYGRADACVMCFEHQRPDALHTHLQLFMQCLHQFASLTEVLAHLRSAGGQTFAGGLLAFKKYCVQETYADPAAWDEDRRRETENDWPEHLTVPGVQATLSG